MAWVAALVLTAGCSQHAAKLSAEESQAFDSAPAEVKQLWDKALTADQARDFVAAQTALTSLDKMILSDAQRKALNAETTDFQLRLMAAVDKQDPKAVQAVQEINRSRNTRN